jgi:hypothetical protein
VTGTDAGAARRTDKLFGIGAVVMVLCCVAGPAVLGAVAGAAIGNTLGIAAAVVVALVGVLLLRRWRGGAGKAC